MRTNTEFIKFAQKLALVLPLLLLVIGVTWWYDPARVFGTRMDNAVEQWARGEPIVFEDAENDRLLIRRYVALLQQPKDVIVIGSSRAMNIHAGLFEGKKFFNASVYARTLQDTLAIYELFREKELLPKVLILEVDPYLTEEQPFHGVFESRWTSLYEPYARIVARIGYAPPLSEYWLELAKGAHAEMEAFSPATFQSALELAHKQLTTPKLLALEEWTLENHPANTFARASDGSTNFSFTAGGSSLEAIESGVRRQLENGLATRGGLRQNQIAVHQFEAFVRSVRQDGVQVYFFLAPYNPLYLSSLSGTRAAEFIREGEVYYQSFASAEHIPLIGSFDPERAGCAMNEFIDGIHPRTSCITQIVEQAHADGTLP